MKCPSCSASIPDTVKFCPECGTRIAGQPNQPAPAKKTPSLSRLSADSLAALLAKHPERAAEFGDGDWVKLKGAHWSALLAAQPQFADRCDISKLSKENRLKLRRRLSPGNLVKLLVVRPDMAEWCNKWSELTGADWAALLSARPEFAEKCAWKTLKDKDWNRLLKAQPQFAKKRKGK